jgi:2-phosphosulfolactate phosphatase
LKGYLTDVAVELGEPGARTAGRRGDVVVLIDALRASTTITCALFAGARRVLPVLHVDEAEALAARHGYLCAGERGGATVPGFDFGNSPTEMLANQDRLRGQTLVLTTSNGTRCVQAALQAGATAVLSGALPNAGAVVQTAWKLAGRTAPRGVRERGNDITLLAAGIEDEPTVEDSFAARWLLQALIGRFGDAVGHAPFEPVVASDSIELFRTSEAGVRLTGLGYADDVAYCAQIDVLRAVPVFCAETGFVLWTVDSDCNNGARETSHD